MKQFVETRTVKKTEINYPSEENPRIEGLGKEHPKIQGLAKNIEMEGLLYPPLLNQQPGKKLDPIDGDRRLIAWFDVLGNSEVKASIWEVDNILELRKMRLAANWDREDFSALEKGSYIWDMITYKMNQDGKTPIGEYWNQRGIRNEYLTWISDVLAKPRSTLARHISLWLRIPSEFHDRIAKSQQDLRKGKISPSKAMKIDLIGRRVKATKKVWKEFVPEHKPATVKTKELNLINKAIKNGQVKTYAQVKDFREEKLPEWSETSFMLKVAEEQKAAELAAQLDIDVSRIYRAGIHLGEEYFEKLSELVKIL